MQRFWKKVDKRGPDECWEWQATKERVGYGQIKSMGQMLMAHRVAFELTVGEIPDGMKVCHKCDNRGCVNPSHLFLGTQSDNMKDCAKKGRLNSQNGNHPRAKLSPDQVLAIRRDKRVQREIAADYGVSISAIGLIIMGRNWKHI